jgi:CubicO group peptidase (beta-lactamase class C family)
MKKYLILVALIPYFAMAQNVSKIDEIFKDYSDKNPGASVGIIQNGKFVFLKNYGLSNLEEATEVNEKTNFRLASVSKQFTAAALLQLIEQNKLSLTTTLSECFPELPAYAKTITIKNLLNHTSGILDYDDVIDENGGTTQLSDADVLKACLRFNKTYFIPGTAYRYSNTAYVLLGLIIEKYSGKSYPGYLAENVFKPAKMKHSVAYVNGVYEISNRAYGYTKKDNKWIRKDQSSTSATLGDGGIYSNLNDLLKWDTALYNDQVLPQSIWQNAFSYQKLNDGTPIDYGFGWHLKKDKSGEQVVYHTGSTTSFRNIIYRIPTKKFSIIILTNRNSPKEIDILGIAEKVLEAWSDGK